MPASLKIRWWSRLIETTTKDSIAQIRRSVLQGNDAEFQSWYAVLLINRLVRGKMQESSRIVKDGGGKPWRRLLPTLLRPIRIT